MTDTLQRARAQSAEVLRRLDRQTGYLWLAGSIDDPAKLRALFQAMQRDSEEIRLESEKLQVLLDQIRNQRRDTVKNFALTVLLVLMTMLLVVGMPARAQDDESLPTATAETVEGTATLVSSEPIVTPAPEATAPPPVVVVPAPQSDVTVPMFYIFSAVIFGLLAAFVLVLRPLVIQLGASAPSWAVEAAFSAGGTLLKSAQDYAGTTPSTVDDELVSELRKEIDSLKQQIADAKKNTQQPGVVG